MIERDLAVAMTPTFRPQGRSFRFVIGFERDEFTLRDRLVLEMEVPPSLDLEAFGTESRSGCWVEVQDARGAVLYRRLLPHPMVRRSEAAAGEAPRTVHWREERGAFSILVPNLPHGADLVMFASPADEPELTGAAVETFRLPLRDRRDGSPQPRVEEQENQPWA
jgi:hypothetical protein